MFGTFIPFFSKHWQFQECQNVHQGVLGKKKKGKKKEKKLLLLLIRNINGKHKLMKGLMKVPYDLQSKPNISEPTLLNIVLYHDNKPNTFIFPDYDHDRILTRLNMVPTKHLHLPLAIHVFLILF